MVVVEAQSDRQRDWLAVAAVIIPLVLIALLILTYVVSPAFFVRYLVNREDRENQVVELATMALALSAGLLLLMSAWRLWRLRDRVIERFPGEEPAGWWHGKLAAAQIGLIGAASIFFGGEEINWGQSLMWVLFPSTWEHGRYNEFNIHNADLPMPSVQSVGSIFLLLIFVVLPAVWSRSGKRSRGELALSMPRMPIAAAILIAMGWSKIKDGYAAWLGEDPESHTVYREFFDQVNEHKEMLVAVALMFYALYCVRAVRQFLPESSTELSTGK